MLSASGSTNFGLVSNDIMNRALPIHLEPVGDIHQRQSDIGNPKLEFLPANHLQIEAELRGMIERWKGAGMPIDPDARHPFTSWAQVVGGILKHAGFRDFLGNYDLRRTEDDPLRQAIGNLGVSRLGEWLRTEDWVSQAAALGLLHRLIPPADRGSLESQRRGLGVVLSTHRDETFLVETENHVIHMQLRKERRRFEGGEPHTRYTFELLSEVAIPEDAA